MQYVLAPRLFLAPSQERLNVFDLATEHLMQLTKKGTFRFRNLKLAGEAGEASEAMAMACKHGHLQVLGHFLQKVQE